ncbi:MAG: ComEA family DNA-binding protein [Firmicutes bacterium]|nr:ComEA family DNA-binding protein [Bacillota bacterium]
MLLNKGLQEKIILGLLVLLLIGGGLWRAVQHKATEFGAMQAGFIRQTGDTGVLGDQGPDQITVHLVGAVASPGVYHLPVGSRVYELLEMGGGLMEEADSEGLNQARPLLDGEQVFVGTRAEAGESPRSGLSQEGKININLATTAELMALPGIGEVRAKQIIEYRDKNGFFTDPRELMDVSGIGEKTYSSIAELITIY